MTVSESTSRRGYAVINEPVVYGRHARDPGPATTLLPLAPHEGEYGMRVRVAGRYVVLIFADGRRPVFLTVSEADGVASAVLKAARTAAAAEVA